MGMMVGNFLCGFFVNFLSGITGGVFTAMFQIVGWGAIICSAIFCIAAIVNTVRTQQGQNEYIS
jgi:LytS/YehU family sensor histidine kinase